LKHLLALPLLLGLGLPTCAADTSLTMSSDPGDYIGGGQDYFYGANDGYFEASLNSAHGVSVIFDTPGFSHWWYLDFAAPYGDPLAVAPYTDATRYPFEAPSEPGLSVAGDGRGCNMLTGSFEVKEVVYGPGDTIVSFRATFEQHCEGALSALRGEIRFHADVPVEISSPRRVSALVGQQVSFDVTATASDGGHVTLGATELPPGATFTDRGDGTGQFVWTPGPAQSGTYQATLTGQDSQGHVEQTVTAIDVGGIIHVPADQPTIQGAIDLALPGSHVLVSPGTYLENIDFRGKAITVESVAGPDATVIDANNAGSVVAFVSVEGRDSVLRGFTLRNGRSGFDTVGFGDGGGIRIRSSSPTIAGNVIRNNKACVGAGISVEFGSPRIEGNVIVGNSQSGCSGGIGGGGISLGGSARAEILNNVIADNTTGVDGGGISLFAAGTPTISGNVVRGNSASHGGGLSIVNYSDAEIIGNLIVANKAYIGGGISWLVPSGQRGPRVVNNTIADNDAPTGSGIDADGFDAAVELVNNIIVANEGQTALYCGDFNDLNPPITRFNDVFSPSGAAYGGICSDQTGRNGNLSTDPLFECSPSGDYGLTSASFAVDAGDDSVPGLPATDVLGTPRVLDGNDDGAAAVDMGALEFDPSAAPGVCNYIFCPADVLAVAPAGQTSAIVAYAAPTAPPGATVACDPPSGAAFPAGLNSVRCTATVNVEHISTCSFHVRVSVPPINDDFDRATVISQLPYSDALDTREATRADDDPECNLGGGTVWYDFTPVEDTVIEVSTTGNTFLAPISAYTGPRGSLSPLGCSYGDLTFTAAAGKSVHLMIGSEPGSGGDLVFSVRGRPALKVGVAISPVGSIVLLTGRTTISGTVTCSKPAVVVVSGELRQRWGRHLTAGTFRAEINCDGSARWSADVTDQDRAFRAIGASAFVNASGMNPETGDQGFAQDSRPIILRVSRRLR
jgi:parallel beta-helix repeat protein